MPTHEMREAYPAPLSYERDRDAQGRPANARPWDRFGRPLPRGAVDELAHAVEPEEAVSTMPEAFDRAVSLFDEERFFEAHEFFEHIWKSDWVDAGDRQFWKGVTQVAVGCCHVQRGNAAGATTLLERAAEYLSGYPDRYRGVDAAALAAAARALAADVRAAGAGPERDFPRFPGAPA
jgi:uncharacterized protein